MASFSGDQKPLSEKRVHPYKMVIKSKIQKPPMDKLIVQQNFIQFFKWITVNHYAETDEEFHPPRLSKTFSYVLTKDHT